MATKEYSCPKCGNIISTSIEEKWIKVISSLPVACPDCGAVSQLKDYKEPIEIKYDGRYVLTPVDNGVNMSKDRIPLHIGSNIIGRLKKDTSAEVNVGIEVNKYVPIVMDNGTPKYHPDRTSGMHAEITIEFDEREIPAFTIKALKKPIYIGKYDAKYNEYAKYAEGSSIKISIGSKIILGDLELRLEDSNSGTID